MIEKRDQLIGIRFTKKEGDIIKSLAKNRDITITDFIREAVFSHINNLKENVGNINIDFFMKNFKLINDSVDSVNESIKVMKKEFNLYDFSKLKVDLLRMENRSRDLESF
ncbi:hypothetical protein LCGC14_1040050 [marine sediment metagenome]|uniref:Uncharacterized protein n=1 Tax=marine sediment metagenome TaxID=412755 RepID=A0A0F9MRY9_9ZZZZ|nr:hypothetical protein [archaeon]